MSFLEKFPYGGAACVLALLALGSGAYLAANPTPKKTTTLTFWTFAKPHYESYQKAIPEFEKTHPGVTVNLQLVAGEAVGQRLRAAFWSNLDVPDMVETEIGTAGTFFRGSLKNVGFLDLTDRINREGWKQKMVATRFSPYTSRGRIFGLPHDVHPVQIAYRKDLWAKIGVDPTTLSTWDEYVAAGEKITRTTGDDKRYALGLTDTGTDELSVMLLQRDGGFFDPDGNCVFDDETGVKTMEYYVPLVAGKKRIGNSLGWGKEANQAVEDGYMLAMLAPDWRTKMLETDVGGASGKMALMPLPSFGADGRHTSTWGGTMMGITKSCTHQDLAWELAKYLYTKDEDLAKRFSVTNIVPPVKSAWNLPEFQTPHPYFGGQSLGRTYANLAPSVPAHYGSPFLAVANGKLSEALVSCVSYYNDHGADGGWDGFVRRTLKEKADYVRLTISRTPDFDKPAGSPIDTAQRSGTPEKVAQTK